MQAYDVVLNISLAAAATALLSVAISTSVKSKEFPPTFLFFSLDTFMLRRSLKVLMHVTNLEFELTNIERFWILQSFHT